MSKSYRVLFLGGNGYIGGAVLDALLSSPKASEIDVTAYVRAEEKAKKIAALGLKTVSGSLPELEEAVANADIVFNCATSDDLPLIETILAGAKKAYSANKQAPILIHTSGSAIVADDTKGDGPSRAAIDDADEATLNALPATAPHRHVDIPLAAAHEEGYIKVYIIAPPMVYGLATGRFVDAGIQNPVPTVLLLITRIAVLRGAFARAGPGKNIWSTVEISDLTRFYLILFERITDGKPLAGGKAYYTTVDGEVVMGEYSDKLAQYLYEFGILKSPAVNELSQEELAKWPIISLGFAVNSRMTDSRSRSLGWKPTHEGKEFLDNLKEAVEVFSKQESDFGGRLTSLDAVLTMTH